MKQTTTVVFDRKRLNTDIADVAFHLRVAVELIAAAGALFDEDEYDLPPGGGCILEVIAREATAAMQAFRGLRVQITGIDPADVDADAVIAELARSA